MRRDGYSVPDITKKFDVKRDTLKNELLKLNEFEIDVNNKHMLGTPEELRIFLDKIENEEIQID